MMPTRRAALRLLAGACAAPGFARAQGFAGLGSDAQGYAVPDPRRALVFPTDHGPHPRFRIEWWYITANLTGPDGAAYGIQWTLFRQAIAPDPQATGWGASDLWLAHGAVTSAGAHRSAEQFARGGVGQAGVVAGPPFAAYIDDWALAGGDLAGHGAPLTLTANGPRFSYALTLSADGPLALHGDGGFSVKSDRGQASRYYSQPWYQAAGQITIDGADTAVTGRAWLDREWSSQPLAADQDGWDWFSLRLPSGAALMLFRLRHTDGGHFLSGSWIAPDGTTEVVLAADIALTPLAHAEVAGRMVPTRWRIEVRSRGVDQVLTPLNQDAWMDTSFAYWEGPVQGDAGAIGYLEMTGY
jgi:predicted secreted hydrolase